MDQIVNRAIFKFQKANTYKQKISNDQELVHSDLKTRIEDD